MGDGRRTVYTGMRPSGKLDKKASKILREGKGDSTPADSGLEGRATTFRQMPQHPNEQIAEYHRGAEVPVS
jgi:hypothetical protein